MHSSQPSQYWVFFWNSLSIMGAHLLILQLAISNHVLDVCTHINILHTYQGYNIAGISIYLCMQILCTVVYHIPIPTAYFINKTTYALLRYVFTTSTMQLYCTLIY